MKRLSRVLIFLAVVLASLAGGAWAQSARGIVRVVVKVAGAPAADLKVVLESAGDSSYSASARTDAQGASRWTDVPLGEVSARVYDAQDQVLVTGKGILEQAGQEITLVLEPDPAP